jgi:prevent-host-death family protein
MTITTISDIKAQFSIFLRKSQREGPVVITENGKPIAVLLAVANEDELEHLLMAHSSELRAILNKGREQIQAGMGIPADEFWQQVEAETT